MEAEIFCRFNAPVSFEPSLSAREFFLVFSIGRCKFWLTGISVAFILQSVIVRRANDFHVRSLGDRVFRFSVHSQAVGFHIYQLRSYECVNFKIYFHLWHGGGPNFRMDYKLWQVEQSSERVDVVKRNSKPNSANLVQPRTSLKSLLIKLVKRSIIALDCRPFLMF